MSIQLRDYQMDAVRRMKNGCILCGGVGSGKSRTSLAYYYLLNKGDSRSLTGDAPYKTMSDPPLNLYIITTARKRDTLEWEGELANFLLTTHKDISIYHHDLVIDSWNNIGKYKDIKDSFFIFDEQRVIGSGEWVKSFLKIVKSNRWVLLSATPGDTWQDYIPVFLANGFYKNKTEFTREHVMFSRFSKFPKVERYLNTGRLVRHRDDILIQMEFERETIPHHEEVFVLYDIQTYKEVSKTRWDPYKNEPLTNAAELCYLWRKIVNSADSRQTAVLEILDRHPKAIIFYSYDYELELLKHLSYSKGTKIAEWNGHKHEPLPTGDKWVYLVQYTAGGEGWNCISTDTIIFYSQNYSYRAMVQAAGRIDRMNTPFTDLYYYHLKSRSGIDLAISRALKEKKNFNETRFVKW